MNTKQFLILGLSFALVANVAAMKKDETLKQRQAREATEAARRRIAEQRAEREANKQPVKTPAVKLPVVATIPVAKEVAKIVTVPANINNNNNVVAQEPAKKAVLPVVVPAKPVAPTVAKVEPKDKEEVEEISIWVRDKAQYLADYNAAISDYCSSVLNANDNNLAEGLRKSLIDAHRARPLIQQERESANIKLQTIDEVYAKDQDFAQLRLQFQALVTIYNLQEQLLDNAHDEDLWNLIDVTFEQLISEQKPGMFLRTLTKLRKCFATAHAAVIESAQNIISEADATNATIQQLQALDQEEVARASEEAILRLEQEEADRRLEEANGFAVAQLLEEDNHRAATGNDALLAQEAADRFAREQEEEDLARALSLQEENRPAVDNDALIAEAVAAQLAAEQEEADRLAAFAFEEDDQPARETDEEFARRMQREWNGQ